MIAIAKQRKMTGPPCPRACTKKHTKKNRPSNASNWNGWSPKMPFITIKTCPTTSTSPATAIAFDSGIGPAPKIRNCTARTGPKKGITSPIARLKVKPTATASATRNPMRRWRDRTASAAAASGGISQDRDQANEYRTQRVRDRIVAGVDDDIHLRTEPHAAPRRRPLDNQSHRETLRVAHPPCRVFYRGQAGIGINAVLRNAPAYALDMSFEDRAGQRVRRLIRPDRMETCIRGYSPYSPPKPRPY